MTRIPIKPLRLTAFAAIFISAACGCTRDVYDVRLEPGEKGLVRTLTVWNESTSPTAATPINRLKPEKLERLADLFAERTTTDADLRQSFRGTFAEKMPADIGGSGTYESYDSPLGSAHWYVERFRGSDDFDAQLYDRRTSADRLADLVVGWFDHELKDSPHKEAVHRALHQDFRQDLRNVSAFFLVSPSKLDAATDDDDSSPGFETHKVPEAHPLVRVAQYCLERGYFTPGELTALIAKEPGREAEVLRLVRRKLGRTLKLTEADADNELAFLAPTPACAESWRNYLRATPEYARLLNAWRKSKEPEEKKPDPLKVVEELVMPTLIDPALLPTGDDVRVALKTPVRPYLTNGEYDADEQIVSWRGSLNAAGFGLPMLCTASWSMPNEKFQVAHFGSIALKGDQLAQFAALYRALPPTLQTEFAKHLAALEPGDALRGRARDFTPLAAVDPAASAALERLKDLLAENL